MFYLKWIFLLSLCFLTGFSMAEVVVKSVTNTADDMFGKHADFIQPLDRKTTSSLYPEVVQLISEDGTPIGTGFFIIPDVIATAYHVTYNHDTQKMRVLYFRDSVGDFPVFLRPFVSDPEHDLALLKTENYKSKYFYPIDPLNEAKDGEITEISSYQSEEGSLIITPGFPGGFFSIAKGTIIGYENFILYALVTDTSTSREVGFMGGLSGAPVLSKDKYLKGIAVQGTPTQSPFEGIGFVHIEKLRDLWKTAEKEIDPSVQKNKGQKKTIEDICNDFFKSSRYALEICKTFSIDSLNRMKISLNALKNTDDIDDLLMINLIHLEVLFSISSEPLETIIDRLTPIGKERFLFWLLCGRKSSEAF